MSKEFNLKHEISIRGMKMLDIGYMFVIGSIVGIIFGKIFSKFMYFDITDIKGNKKKYPNTTFGKLRLAGEIMLEVAMYGIVLYIIRQFVQGVSWPFDGWKGWNPPVGFKGYDHYRNSESKNPWSLGFFFFIYQNSLKTKISYLFNMFKGTPLSFLVYDNEKNTSEKNNSKKNKNIKKNNDDTYNNANLAIINN